MRARWFITILNVIIINLIFINSNPALSQGLNEKQIDSLAKRTIQLFQVPGLEIGIIKGGKLIYSKGFGVRSLNSGQTVDPRTLFGIASNTKAFTAAALGILVDQGKIHWDDKVTHYIPEFRLYDNLATREITIRDLLCHRSGLATGAGDLMHDPDSTNFTVKDIIYNLRYIKPSYSFRNKFAYDNNLYLVAGEVIARVSKMRWEDFVEQQILKPLGMVNSAASYNDCKQSLNIIDAHKKINDSIKVVTRYTSEKDDAAGGIYSNVEDMSKWMLMLLDHGKYGLNLEHQLLTEQTVNELFSPQTIIPTGNRGVYHTHFTAYGLGWFLLDVKGYKQVVHTGEDVGMVSEVAMIPELELGIVVLTNNESNAIDAITYQILDSYLDIKGVDESKSSLNRLRSGEQSAYQEKIKILSQLNKYPISAPSNKKSYIGTYKDKWFGNIKISLHKKSLWFASERSPQLRGTLQPLGQNTFYVRWQNPDLDSYAIVIFKIDYKNVVSSFSFGGTDPYYEGLSFKRIKN
ncbi:serine hydrolase [Mucilaginibacter sp.]|uniref:serine hydrolase n=1 Tax=Mucilaginibacter sp. TaxID=1882438 RepID=UPI003D0E4B2C